MLKADRLPFDRRGDERNDECGAWILDREERRLGLSDEDIELLSELAACSAEVTLAILELSARELPKTAVALVCGTLTDQVAIFPANDGRQNSNVITQRDKRD